MADADPGLAPVSSADRVGGMSWRRKIFLGSLGLALVIGVAYKGYDWMVRGRFIESTDNAYIEADISVIAPKVQGYVREVRVQDNQRVQRGQILAVIDDSEYRAKLAQAEAAVETARAGIENVNANTVKQNAAIGAARADVAAKRAESIRALDELQRVQRLRDAQWVSTQRFQSAEADAKKSAADVVASQAGVLSQQAQMDVLAAQARVALGYYRQNMAAVDTARLDVDNTVLRAPIDGVVGNRAVRVGQFVRPGTVLMAVVPLADVYIVANFKETQLRGIKIGQKADVRVDSFPQASIDAVVDSFSPAAGSRFSILPPENATGNFTKIVQRIPIKIRLTKVPPDIRLTPGMSVEVSVSRRHA